MDSNEGNYIQSQVNMNIDEGSSRSGRPFLSMSEIVFAGTMALTVSCFCSGLEAAQEQDESSVVATVNGEAMLLEDLELYLSALHRSAAAGERSGFDLDRLMFRAVNDMLLAQEARYLGMDQEEAIANQVVQYRDRLVLAVLERREISEKALPTEEELRQFFEDQYRVITLRVATALEQDDADEMLAEVRAGADMEALALDRSVDPYGPRGGLIDSVDRIDLQPEIAELALGLEPGKIAGPVRTDLGWSFIRLETIEKADPERFPELQRFIRSVVMQRKAQELRKALAASLRVRHPVSIDDDVLRSFRPKRLPDSTLVPDGAEPDTIVARVGKTQVVTAGEYSRALLMAWTNVRNEEAALAAAPGALERLIDQRLLLAEALARGYAERHEIQRRVRAHERELLVPLYLEEVVAADVTVSREEMTSYFEEHKQEYRKPPRIHLGQITVATMEEAERIAGLLRQGTDLAWLARQHSTDRFKSAGGDRGWVAPRPGGPDDRLLEAAVGDVLDPFGDSDNYRVIKVLAREEQGLYEYDEVSGNVRSVVYSQKLRSVMEKFMDTLRSRSEIEINEELLKSLQITGEEKAGSPHPGPGASLLGTGICSRQKGEQTCA